MFIAFAMSIVGLSINNYAGVAEQTLNASIGQNFMSSSLLSKTVERDLMAGNFRYAWMQLNRAVDPATLVGFLILDESGQLLVEDRDFEAKYRKIVEGRRWTFLDNDKRLQISGQNDYLVVFHPVAAVGTPTGQARVVFIYNISLLEKALKGIRLSYAIFGGLLLLFSLIILIFLRRSFESSFHG